MKCIVTGGAGFIGSNLVEALIKLKYKIIVIDNFSTGRIENLKDFEKKIKIVKADISKKGYWQKYFYKVNIVFHLAALADIVPSIANPQSYFDSNVISPGTLFMQKLSKELEKTIKAKKFNVNKVILSDTSVVGEGEHKIIPYIKKNIKEKSEICIYGDDADLIFLSMTLLDKEHSIKIMKSQSLEDTNFEEIK